MGFANSQESLPENPPCAGFFMMGCAMRQDAIFVKLHRMTVKTIFK